MITITQEAADKVKELIESQDHGHDKSKVGIRVYVKGGGCSGFEQGLSLDEARENDWVFESNGVKVFADPASYRFLKDVEIRYERGKMSEGFKINNPNIKSTCGCGESFEPKDSDPSENK